MEIRAATIMALGSVTTDGARASGQGFISRNTNPGQYVLLFELAFMPPTSIAVIATPTEARRCIAVNPVVFDIIEVAIVDETGALTNSGFAFLVLRVE